ncbi:MAG: ATP-binding protein [Deltaproteobacteria bacterium]|jgi:hypothetical protein|nr:ATP-binding protein [Deltaproteobacteria bacterium]
MTQKLPFLPAGTADFEVLRKKNGVYVDKTMYIPELFDAGQFIFCARPRRFGKSLTVSALDDFCSGRQELFRGLEAEKVMSSPDFVVRPVIRLDMSQMAGSKSEEILINKIMRHLSENAARHNVSLRGADCPDTFSCLLKDVHEASGQKVVLLIDEYDDPVIRLIEKGKQLCDSKLLDGTRDVMQDLYKQIKGSSKDIEFAFITGITKFSRMGMFSKLNNLTDISLLPKFGAFMGYTHDELTTYFEPFITATALELGMSEEKLLDEIRDYYDGFSFDGKVELYNPFSVLTFFQTGKFGNFWMESGSNTLVRTFLRDKELTAEEFRGGTVGFGFARTPGEIDATSPKGLLYQAGYLTLREDLGQSYVLDYPNREVREAISILFLENVNSDWDGIENAGLELSGFLTSGNVPGMVSVFRRLLAGIHYSDHLDANRAPQAARLQKTAGDASGAELPDPPQQARSETLADKLSRKKGESWYRSLLQTCLWTAGAKVTPEKSENKGRLDLEAVFGRMTYVIELKVSDDARGAAAAVRAGMDQIHERGYGRATDNPVLVSLAVGRAERNIVGCLFERDGQETAVEVEV